MIILLMYTVMNNEKSEEKLGVGSGACGEIERPMFLVCGCDAEKRRANKLNDLSELNTFFRQNSLFDSATILGHTAVFQLKVAISIFFLPSHSANLSDSVSQVSYKYHVGYHIFIDLHFSYF